MAHVVVACPKAWDFLAAATVMSVLFVHDALRTRGPEEDEEAHEVYTLHTQARTHGFGDDEESPSQPNVLAIQIRQSVEVVTDVEVLDVSKKGEIPDLRGQSDWS